MLRIASPIRSDSHCLQTPAPSLPRQLANRGVWIAPDRLGLRNAVHPGISPELARRSCPAGEGQRNPRDGLYLVELEVITNFVPSSENKICRTPCRKQLLVQAFIAASAMIFRPCCIFTQTRAHRFSSMEWQLHRQHSARSRGATGRETPVSVSEATTTARRANLGPHFLEVLNRFNSQIKGLFCCMFLARSARSAW